MSTRLLQPEVPIVLRSLLGPADHLCVNAHLGLLGPCCPHHPQREAVAGQPGRKPKYTDERGKVKIRGILFCTYMIQLITKTFLEVEFIVGQFYIFGFIFIPLYYHFSGISVIQNIIEVIYLLCNKSRAAKKRLLDHSSQPYASNPAWKGTSSPNGVFLLPPPPCQDRTDLRDADKHFDSFSKEKDT
ncbi:hypothetical protein Q5P01_000710 [Channa striata]|uniref:Uncharacterized protein n=1 Tax=Channa striata TaxID=64152 RepID=A0AA88ID76_CHASR|nr:hypothetical protein Q5P01_000710 [Channa striata]